jgi:hypothetical protein
MNLNRRTIAVVSMVVLAPVVLAIAGSIAFVVKCTVVRADDRYGSLELKGSEESYYMLSTSSPERCALFIDVGEVLPDGERKLILLRAVTEQMLLDAGFDRDHGNQLSGSFYDTVFQGRGATIQFDRGKIVAMHFIGSELQFSNLPNGPRLTLPVEYVRLHAVFGKPDLVHRTREQRPIRLH